MIGKVIVRSLAPYKPVDLSRLPERGGPTVFGAYMGPSGRVGVVVLTREMFDYKAGGECRPYRLWCDADGKPELFESYSEAVHAVNRHFRSDRIDPADLMPSHTDFRRVSVPDAIETE